MSLSCSSYSSYSSWTEDSDDYATFNATRSASVLPSTLCENNANIDKSYLDRNWDALPGTDENEKIMEPIYENFKSSTVATLYGQILRSKLDNVHGKKKRISLEGTITRLFDLDAEGQRLDLVTRVEKRLDELLEENPERFRQIAEKMCEILSRANKKKINTRFTNIRKRIQNMFTK